jgi:hypothetical protein
MSWLAFVTIKIVAIDFDELPLRQMETVTVEVDRKRRTGGVCHSVENAANESGDGRKDRLETGRYTKFDLEKAESDEQEDHDAQPRQLQVDKRADYRIFSPPNWG